MNSRYCFLYFFAAYLIHGIMSDVQPQMMTAILKEIKMKVHDSVLITSEKLHENNLCPPDIYHEVPNSNSTESSPQFKIIEDYNTCKLCSNGCRIGNESNDDYENKEKRNNTCHSLIFFKNDSKIRDVDVFKIYHHRKYEKLVVKEMEMLCGNYVNCTKLTERHKPCKRRNPPRSAWAMVEDLSLLLSSLCLLFTIFIHLALPEMRNLHGKNISCFSFSTLVSEVFMFHDFGVKERKLCIGIAVMLNYFWLVVFTWTSVLAFDIARTFYASNILRPRREESHSRRFGVYCLVAWGLPLAVVSITYFVTSNFYDAEVVYHQNGKCFLQHRIMIYSFGIPLSISLIFNIFCFSIIIYGIETRRRKSTLAISSSSRKKNDRFRCFIYAKLSVMCGISWIIFILVPYFGHVAELVFDFQGILIFLSTVLLNRRAIEAVKNLSSKKSDSCNNNVELSTISR